MERVSSLDTSETRVGSARSREDGRALDLESRLYAVF